MDPNWVVNHAYNAASYILEHDNPIQDGETIDGVADGRMCREIQWKCQYEDALIQPPRGVPVSYTHLDVYKRQIQDYALPFFARFSNLPKLLEDVEQEGFFPHRKGFDVPKRDREFLSLIHIWRDHRLFCGR